MAQEPLSKATFLVEGQDGAVATVNEAIQILAIAARRSVIDKRNAPPGSPTNGNCYLVGSSPSGAWTSLAENTIVCWSSTLNSWIATFTLAEGDYVSVNNSGGGISTAKTLYVLGAGGASDFEVVKTWN